MLDPLGSLGALGPRGPCGFAASLAKLAASPCGGGPPQGACACMALLAQPWQNILSPTEMWPRFRREVLHSVQTKHSAQAGRPLIWRKPPMIGLVHRKQT